MQGSNYDNDLWPLIYDQFNTGRHERELGFYVSQLGGCTGPVLEAACGTGSILLALLAAGRDAHGFDVSAPMLRALLGKPDAARTPDLHARVTRQDLVDFRYPFHFEAVCIPGRSFLHLLTRDAQERCLRNVLAHLRPGGRLLLNFFNPDPALLAERSSPSTGYTWVRAFRDARTGHAIALSYRQRNDVAARLQEIEWRFEVGGREHSTLMRVSWLSRSEFEQLLGSAGFAGWQVFGDFDLSPCAPSSPELIWIARRPG